MTPIPSNDHQLMKVFILIRNRCQYQRFRQVSVHHYGQSALSILLRKSSLTYKLIFILSICVLLEGCDHKDIIYPDNPCLVDVRFLWEKAPEAHPEGMTLLFYPEDHMGEFWRFEISGRDGGLIEITPGKYTLITVNNDLRGIRLTDTPYAEASLTTVQTPYTRTFALPTGMVYETKIENLTITPNKATYYSEKEGKISFSPPVVNCYPDSISTIYNIIVDQIDGIERVKSAECVFEGCSEGILLSSLTPFDRVVYSQFVMDLNADKGTLTGSTSGFSSNSIKAKYGITLRVAYHAGGGYEKYFDVTEQVKNSFYPRSVYINIKGLVLPEEPTIDPDEVGMKVDVDGWKSIEINLDSENYFNY